MNSHTFHELNMLRIRALLLWRHFSNFQYCILPNAFVGAWIRPGTCIKMFHVDFNLNRRFAWLRSGNVPNPFRDACISFDFLFVIVHPKKQDVQMKVHQPQVSLLVHKKHLSGRGSDIASSENWTISIKQGHAFTLISLCVYYFCLCFDLVFNFCPCVILGF